MIESDEWVPRTLEDRLLERYLREHPGLLFLEVEVGGRDATRGPRRLDGVLVPGEPVRVRQQHSYDREELAEAVRGREIHVLEAKRSLNRNVIGQVEVGSALFTREFAPGRVVGVSVCAADNADLAWYCGQRGLCSVVYDDVRPPDRSRAPAVGQVRDIRNAPDARRRLGFMQGWDDAVRGELYDSVRTRKTHANMGNLFGWIYGDQPDGFKEETWARYIDALPEKIARGRAPEGDQPQ